MQSKLVKSWLLSVLSTVMCLSTGNAGAAADSVEAVMVRFNVSSGMDPRYRELIGDPLLSEVLFLVRDPYVIVKAVAAVDDGTGTFMLFDTRKKHAYRALIKDDRIYAMFERILSQERPTELISGESREIAGLECKKALVIVDGVECTTWYTDIIGTDFSLFGDVPGIPLYYEQPDKEHEKLVYEAREVYRLMSPGYIFDTGDYGMLNEANRSNREVMRQLVVPENFSKEDIYGNTFDLSEQEGRVTVLSFWDPARAAHRVDKDVLCRLDSIYEDKVTFVALNPYRTTTQRAVIDTSNDRRIHIPSAKPLFKSYEVGEVPKHVIIDSEGRIRYTYTGVFGMLFENALIEDLRSLGAER